MSLSRTAPAGDRIIEPMVALAGCSKQHRIVVAGAKEPDIYWSNDCNRIS